MDFNEIGFTSCYKMNFENNTLTYEKDVNVSISVDGDGKFICCSYGDNLYFATKTTYRSLTGLLRYQFNADGQIFIFEAFDIDDMTDGIRGCDEIGYTSCYEKNVESDTLIYDKDRSIYLTYNARFFQVEYGSDMYFATKIDDVSPMGLCRYQFNADGKIFIFEAFRI